MAEETPNSGSIRSSGRSKGAVTNHDNSPKPWELIRSTEGPDLILFRTRFDLVEGPRNFFRMEAVVLETPDWVNIVATTSENRIVIVKQYRFGVGKLTTEIPAGIVDPEETHEEAAIRELREETGYSSSKWSYLGWVEPNPAYQTNRCHHWLAAEVRKTCSPRLDESEDISVSEASLEDLQSEIREGRMRNALSLLALSRVFDLRGICERTRS